MLILSQITDSKCKLTSQSRAAAVAVVVEQMNEQTIDGIDIDLATSISLSLNWLREELTRSVVQRTVDETEN